MNRSDVPSDCAVRDAAGGIGEPGGGGLDARLCGLSRTADGSILACSTSPLEFVEAAIA